MINFLPIIFTWIFFILQIQENYREMRQNLTRLAKNPWPKTTAGFRFKEPDAFVQYFQTYRRYMGNLSGYFDTLQDVSVPISGPGYLEEAEMRKFWKDFASLDKHRSEFKYGESVRARVLGTQNFDLEEDGQEDSSREEDEGKVSADKKPRLVKEQEEEEEKN